MGTFLGTEVRPPVALKLATEAGSTAGEGVSVSHRGVSGPGACGAAARSGRIIMMSRYADRQKLALECGATDVVAERGDEGVAVVKDLTHGLGVRSSIEAVATSQAKTQASGPRVRAVTSDTSDYRTSSSPTSTCTGAPPVRRFLPELIDLIRSAPSTRGRPSTSSSLSIEPVTAIVP